MNINRNIAREYPWGSIRWDRRAKFAASVIPAGSSVLDLGGGFCRLHEFLRTPVMRYVSLDREAWTDATVVCDFSFGSFPDVGMFQYLACLGTLEYLEDPRAFLVAIRRYGDVLLLSYNRSVNAMRKNNLTKKALVTLLAVSGWEVRFKTALSPQHTVYYCTSR